jgi:hypothetical protein
LLSKNFYLHTLHLITSSQNGYVAGFIVLPLLFLFAVASLILLVTGFVCLGLGKKSAPWLLLSAVLLPASFISSALIAKYFEIGAYHEEPMVSFSDETTSVVLFKEGMTNEQIEDFWNKTMSLERADGRGRDHLPGVRTMWREKAQNGREVMAFGFFPNATAEQRQFVFARVKSSPMVYQLIENQSMKEFNANSAKSFTSANSNMPLKKFLVTDSTNSK